MANSDNKANAELKSELKRNNVNIYEIAYYLGISEQKLYRTLSKPINKQQEKAIKDAMSTVIQKHLKEKKLF